MKKYPAVILAGRPPQPDEVMQYANVQNKVLIPFRGRTLLENSIQSVLPFASRIIIVGLQKGEIPVPDEVPVDFLDMEGEQYDKIYKGLEQAAEHTQDHAIVLSGDLPLITAELVGKFLEDTGEQDADFYYPVIPKEVFDRDAPDLEWGYMKIKDGKYASGNVVLVRPSMVLDKYDMIKFLSTNRKSFILGVLRASPWIFLKLIFNRVRMHEAERLMTKMFGIESKLVVYQDHRIAFDIDLPEHVDYIRKIEQT